MSQITIKKLITKDGVSQNGKPWRKYSILTIDKTGQEIWLGCFASKGTNSTIESWRDGDTVDIEVYQDEYNNKVSWNFKEPAERNVFTELDEIKAKLDLILQGKKVEPELTVEEIEKTFSEEPKEPPMSDIPDFLRH